MRRKRLSGWRLPVILLGLAFAIGWFGLWIFEPTSNNISRPAEFWWYFIVTITTIGYGDKFPVTGGGHVVAAITLLVALLAFSILISTVADGLKTFQENQKRGLFRVTHENHYVLFGYDAGRTPALMAELESVRVVLATSPAMADRNPLSNRDDAFVCGQLDGAKIMELAGIPRAQCAIIDVADDNLAMRIALAALESNPGIHVVVAALDLGIARSFARIRGNIDCVTADMPTMVAAEAINPGTGSIINVLADPSDPAGIHTVVVPAQGTGKTWPALAHWFADHGGILLGVRVGDTNIVNPASHQLETNQALFYIHSGGLGDHELAGLWA